MTEPAPAFAPRSAFLQRIVNRGFLHQCTDLEQVDNAATGNQLVAYIGFDATADSLHVGSLVQIMMLRQLQQAGHKPIVLMGGGTTKIGDPSGKDEQRQLISEETIASNIAGIRQIFEKFLTFGDGPTDAVIVNNAQWLDELQYIEFLREYGRHFSVNRMLSFESVKTRLEREQPLSFLEFNYMILQAYDFLELSRRYGCNLQLGGSDQWGNIVAGVELGRRVASTNLYGLTSPLLTTASGAKMGKTAAGAVWLNAERLSSYDYWQYWRNTEDADVGRFLRLFTELGDDEIQRLSSLQGAQINDAKVTLANEVTRLCHGEDAASAAENTANQTFAGVGYGDDLPRIDVARASLEQGVLAYELLREAGLAKSNGEARRLIKGGGARINDVPIASDNVTVTINDLNSDGVVKLSAGKKRHALISPAN
ncbi:MAG: tyrosyl-tRNA synthetase [Gammaproteobacteria bacterium]|jgi:tyrosyl-tRNA synthetase